MTTDNETNKNPAPENKGFDFSKILTWKEGITELSIEKVKDALNSSISPSRTIEGRHPLTYLLDAENDAYMSFKRSPLSYLSILSPHEPEQSETKSETSEEIFKKKSDIIDLLLTRGVSLFEKQDTEETLIDTLLYNGDIALTSKLVFAAIKESVSSGNGAYILDIDNLVQKERPKENAKPSSIQKARNKLDKKLKGMEEIHSIVKLAIQNPSREEDKNFCQNHAEKLKFWTASFKKPNDAELDKLFPVDKEALEKENQEAMENNPMASMLGMRSRKKEDDENIQILEKENPQDILAEIDTYIGMEQFKENMESLVFRVQFNQARQGMELKTGEQNFHTAFIGNPGTGKTTTARIKARLLYALDMAGPRYAELSRDKIISPFWGDTEGKVAKLLDNVDTLFVDEAYSLSDGSGSRQDYGQRAVDAMVGAMGGRKDKFTLFLAGYNGPMQRFIESNEGLSSRVKIFEEMQDFTTPELSTIFNNDLISEGYEITQEARDLLLTGVEAEKKKAGQQHFGNARVVVSLVQELPNQIAGRLGREFSGNFSKCDKNTLSLITAEDVKGALATRSAIGNKEPEYASVGEKECMEQICKTVHSALDLAL